MIAPSMSESVFSPSVDSIDRIATDILFVPVWQEDDNLDDEDDLDDEEKEKEKEKPAARGAEKAAAPAKPKPAVKPAKAKPGAPGAPSDQELVAAGVPGEAPATHEAGTPV